MEDLIEKIFNQNTKPQETDTIEDSIRKMKQIIKESEKENAD